MIKKLARAVKCGFNGTDSPQASYEYREEMIFLYSISKSCVERLTLQGQVYEY